MARNSLRDETFYLKNEIKGQNMSIAGADQTTSRVYVQMHTIVNGFSTKYLCGPSPPPPVA